MKLSTLIYASVLAFSVTNLAAQEPKKEEKKIQEVIEMTADPIPPVTLADGTVVEDTSGVKPMPVAEILKRAVNFVKIESTKYTKGNGVTTGSKAECVATFAYKPKELNPQADVQGTFTMHLSIDAKEGKYRYTISKITHNAKNAEYSGGDIYSEVPKCGSMKLPNEMWKHMRSEALKDSGILASDLKAAMKKSSSEPQDKDEW
jgi:hypothetical protein